MFNIIFDWIQTADLWSQKRPLYQLRHNFCFSGSSWRPQWPIEFLQIFTFSGLTRPRRRPSASTTTTILSSPAPTPAVRMIRENAINCFVCSWLHRWFHLDFTSTQCKKDLLNALWSSFNTLELHLRLISSQCDSRAVNYSDKAIKTIDHRKIG